MGKKAFIKKIMNTPAWQERFAALFFTLLLAAGLGLIFDYYYCMNDDVTMRDILSGSYTGMPEGRNIQMLFPISAVIGLLYRLLPGCPVYGLFLCGCQFLAFYLICRRTMGLVKRLWVKIVVGAMAVFLVTAGLLYEFVYVQYTMTCAMLMAAAIFCFYTSEREKEPAEFLKENMTGIVLVVVAFCIRSEMALLLLPFLLGAGLFKWAKEEKFFSKKNIQKYIGVFGTAVLGMLLCLLANKASVQAPQWQEFNRFFDARTEIYDFLGWATYEEDADFYEKEGMGKAEAELIENYNFALNDNVNADFMERMAVYQKEKKGSAIFLMDTKEAVWIYKNTLLSAEYMPYNGLILFLYLLLAGAAFYNRDKSFLWKIPLLGLLRSVCWFYIILRGRTPERITHGLLLAELILLFALLAGEWRRARTTKITVSAIACVIAALSLPGTWEQSWNEAVSRENINREWILLQEYCKENYENYYVIDVYSSVSYTEKMFENVDNSYRNFDLCGGWTAKSPLYEKKLALRQIENLENALAEREDVFFVSKANRSVEWLESYYGAKGRVVEVKEADKIMCNGEVRFVIYRLL